MIQRAFSMCQLSETSKLDCANSLDAVLQSLAFLCFYANVYDRFDQLQSNVEVCSKGLLSAELLDAAEKLWEDVKGDVKDFSD